MPKKLFLILTLIALAALPVRPTRMSDSGAIVLEHVTVIDATGSPPLADATVVIAAGRIVALGRSAELGHPPGVRVVDASGQFLIPGLWDMHVHALQARLPEPVFAALIANGVLGVRDMGSPPQQLDQIRYWRSEAEHGVRLVPRLVAAGPMIDGPKPMFPDLSVAVSSESEARQTVASIAEGGADFIKVYSLLPRDAYFGIADESRRRGLVFAGHVPDSVTAAEASDAGQSSIEHLSGVWLSCSGAEDELRGRLLDARAAADPSLLYRALRSLHTKGVLTYDRTKAESLFRRFVRNGTRQVPTLGVARAAASLDERSIARTGGTARARSGLRDLTAENLAFAKASPGRILELVRVMRAAGVEFMAGTDAPNPFALPGLSLHTELELLVEAGFTPMEALQAATIKPAQYLGLQDQLGTVEAGKIADLVLLEANPLDDIRNTRRIAGVVLRGRLLLKSELEEELAKLNTPFSGGQTGFPLPAPGPQGRKPVQASRQRSAPPSREKIREAEQRLSDLGYWTGPIDGAPDEGLRHALVAFQKVEGRKRTGLLNGDELQALRIATRPLPVEKDYPHLEVDLRRQVLFVLEATGVTRILPVSTGSGELFTSSDWTRRACTPCGRFRITRKIVGWHKSELGLMYYPNYLVGGVAIHGSVSVPATPSSHGCIRIPMFAAKEFSEMTPLGTLVIVHDNGLPKPSERNP